MKILLEHLIYRKTEMKNQDIISFFLTPWGGRMRWVQSDRQPKIFVSRKLKIFILQKAGLDHIFCEKSGPLGLGGPLIMYIIVS